MFAIEIGSQKIFKFRGGEPYWYGVELTATAQEVTDYDPMPGRLSAICGLA